MPLAQDRLDRKISEGLFSTIWKYPLTVHLDPPLPLFLLGAVLGLDATNRRGGWGCGLAPVRREEFDISVGDQR